MGDKGERSEVYCLFRRYLCHGILFICSHITFAMVYSFYFLSFGSRRNECNRLWGRDGREIRILLIARKVSRPEEKNDILRQYNDKFIMCSDRACGIILLSVTASWRQYQNKPRPSDLSPLSLPKTIGFIPSGANKQKKEILPYPRCGFGACLRCG